MDNIKSLEKIKTIYILKYDSAIAKVALIENEHKKLCEQLEEIITYHNEYCAYLKFQCTQGINSHQLKNQYQFIDKFTPVITQQKSIVNQSQLRLIEEKNVLHQCYKDLKALEYILDVKNTVLMNLKNKQELAEQEENVLNKYIINKQN